eukprot:CAMPEP_0181043792 /NCGR_PEP_ID=MMETSP1070-20121207/12905_1 /TAXON_ID=265543 /ORGANISM="Minutocellus polymorphus, Strain NH13" /LENGTH=68 /DNA_ID=CAMNT_0023122161 /DNA_START=250 /DNA_END=456 /DNA_ORIENTATION=+
MPFFGAFDGAGSCGGDGGDDAVARLGWRSYFFPSLPPWAAAGWWDACGLPRKSGGDMELPFTQACFTT